MFIFDFVAETVLDQIIDWLYGKIVGFLNDFFAMMNNMGVELFDLPWVNAITTFFSWLGWALFVVGLVVGAFECAIEYQGGRGSIKDTALNYVKGFMAVSLFSILPRAEYTRLLQAAGFGGLTFYYPYPDHKFPSVIYSDEWLPQKGELAEVRSNYDRDRVACFNERVMFDSLLEEGVFQTFSNSFLIEAVQEG